MTQTQPSSERIETKLKAYKVACVDDDHGSTVVFAASSKDVDRYANSDQCDCDYLEKTRHRAPEFDKYAPGPVTTAQYLAEGWYWECCGCGKQLHSEDGPIIGDRDDVFCNRQCVDATLARWTDADYKNESVKRLVASVRRLIKKLDRQSVGAKA